MGVFREYLNKEFTQEQLKQERRTYLHKISELLECDVLAYAADTNYPDSSQTAIDYGDLLPFVDLIDGLHHPKKRIAVILETFGGAGEVGRDMVEILHERFDHVMFIVPGWAKSTGTIMAMGGHEILMGPASALGPIDAQLMRGDQFFSADALLEGLKVIKEEVEKTGRLNLAYYPILEKLSPGELQHAQNALKFAQVTVREWLCKYKFSNWRKTETRGLTVDSAYREQRADEIATALSSQSRWYTHGRSLRIPDLQELGLKIIDFSEDDALFDAIQRYQVLLRLTFQGSTVVKIIETLDAQVVKRTGPDGPGSESSAPASDAPQEVESVCATIGCPHCSAEVLMQLDFAPDAKLQPGASRWPQVDELPCPNCGVAIDLHPARSEIEAHVGRPSFPPPTR